MEASKAFKKSRTTIYESIKNGDISRDSDGLIDLSELLRVYGNPVAVQSSTRTEHVQRDAHEHIQLEVEIVLKEQISLLKNQLDLANQREKALMHHIEDLTYRIDFKGNLESNKQSETDSPEVNRDDIQANISKSEESGTDNKRIPIPEITEEEPPKRGFWSRFFLPNG